MRLKGTSLLTILLLGSLASPFEALDQRIQVFAGIASRAPLTEAAEAFEKESGLEVELHFGASGAMLAQLVLGRRGDLYIPASEDFLDKAERRGIIKAESRTLLAYLLPAVLVAQGNPKRIASVEDLARPGLRIGIGNPETVAAGAFAVEILAKVEEVAKRPGLRRAIERNIVTQALDVEALANLLLLKRIDAAIGWREVALLKPKRLEALLIPLRYLPRLGRLSGALTRFSADPEAAGRFLAFLASSPGKAIFRRHGHLVEEGEVRQLLSHDLPSEAERLPQLAFRLP